jgi:hypothetical protein
VRREAVLSFATAPRACSLTWATAHNWFTDKGSLGSTPDAQECPGGRVDTFAEVV